MHSVNRIILISLVVFLAACGGMSDDLNPSGKDLRPAAEAGTIGPAVGQTAPGFTVYDSLGNSVSLQAAGASSKAVVLYFTMWCPVCDTHMRHMETQVLPDFPGARFLLVDYVSGSVAEARSSQLGNGYGTAPFIVLVDYDQSVLKAYNATMGTTVVIDASGVIRLNEDYKDGQRLREVLGAL